MANICEVNMKVALKGDRYPVDSLVVEEVLAPGISYPNIYEVGEDYFKVSFDCRWSIYSHYNGYDFFEELSDKYNCDIELFSSEPGCAFREHIIIRDGCVRDNEIYEYQEVDLRYNYETGKDFSSKEECEEFYGITLDDETWENEDWMEICDCPVEWSI